MYNKKRENILRARSCERVLLQKFSNKTFGFLIKVEIGVLNLYQAELTVL